MIEVSGVRGSELVGSRRDEVVHPLVEVAQLGHRPLLVLQELVQPLVAPAELARGAMRDRQGRRVKHEESDRQQGRHPRDEGIDVVLDERVVLIELGDRDHGTVAGHPQGDVDLQQLVGELAFLDVLGRGELGDVALDGAVEDLAQLPGLLFEPEADDLAGIGEDDGAVGVEDLDPDVAPVRQDALAHDAEHALVLGVRERPREVQAGERRGEDRVGDEG
ncbi:MAG: hypothetical protein WD965_03265 [Actinomycetota bacterium]